MDKYHPSLSNPSSCGSTSAAAAKSKKKRAAAAAAAKLSTDPQSVAARQRRHRISDRFKILQSLVPGGSKMDTVSMLEQAIQYVKFLKAQIWLHQAMINLVDADDSAVAAAAPPPVAAISSYQQLNFDQDRLDLRGDCCAMDRLMAECGNLPESWFSGGENWGSGASMQN